MAVAAAVTPGHAAHTVLDAAATYGGRTCKLFDFVQLSFRMVCFSGFRGRGRKRLQFLSRLEANCFTGRNIHLLAGARIAADASLARLDVEHAEASELDPLAASERVLHCLEDGLDRLFGFSSADIRLLYNRVDEVELD